MLFLIAATSAFGADAWRSQIAPFFQRNCTACHNAALHQGGIDFSIYKDSARALEDRDVFERALRKLNTGEMPPKGLPRPNGEQARFVEGWFAEQFGRIDAKIKPDPGRVTARRLNRGEYNRTVSDLLGIDIHPANDFPPDDTGYGFDTIGDVLSVSPVLMERYLRAADKLASAAIVAGPVPAPTVRRRGRPPNWTNSFLESKHTFPADGRYKLRLNVAGERSKDRDIQATLSVDGHLLETFDISLHPDSTRVRETETVVAAGEHVIRAEFVKEAQPKEFIAAIEIRGPYDGRLPLTESHRRIFVCAEKTPECAKQILSALARRAWRRPVTGAEVERLAAYVSAVQKEGASFEEGVQVALKAILVSPNFLFRIERDPRSDTSKAAHRLTDLELASRLSYFLWSSMPDEELLRLAEQGRLSDAVTLRVQVRRMMQNKSNALAENFAGQWLELRTLDGARPDPQRFPAFDEPLRKAMKQETTLFFDSIMRENRSIFEFLSANYTFLNDRLAKHYGVSGVTGPEFRRVELPDVRRGGLLTQASLLTVSSYPSRTSPVLRGKYVLENFLNAAPPPPPPDVPPLDDQAIGEAVSMRKQLEAHRANAICASCHARMDPIGFGLENYDAIGAWRASDGKFPIDAAGELPGGQKFEGAAGLRTILLERKAEFRLALIEKLLTYGLGRGVERYDRPAIQSISRKMAASGDTFANMVAEIVNSLPFRQRRGEASAETVRR